MRKSAAIIKVSHHIQLSANSQLAIRATLAPSFTVSLTPIQPSDLSLGHNTTQTAYLHHLTTPGVQ